MGITFAQLLASANAPWTRTIDGLGRGAAATETTARRATIISFIRPPPARGETRGDGSKRSLIPRYRSIPWYRREAPGGDRGDPPCARGPQATWRPSAA